MNFDFTDEQISLRDLAREILEGEVSAERLKSIEGAGDFFDRDLWSRLAEANLLGLGVPEAQGGMGLGFLDVCLLLHEIGRAVAPLPALTSLVSGLAIAEFGNDAQRDRWLTPLAKGELVLSASLAELAPVSARRDANAWILDGSCSLVPAAELAGRVLVAGRLGAEDSRDCVFLVDPKAPGVTHLRRQTSRKEPVSELSLAGVSVTDAEVLRGEDIAQWLQLRMHVGIAATQVELNWRWTR